MIIGITGGIGSGKSTIAKEFVKRGFQLYDTDAEAKRLIVEDSGLRTDLSALLGSDVYEGDVYRTDLVAQRVFQDPDLLCRLNALVHPAVRRDIEHTCCRLPVACGLIIESALLFEAGLDDLCDKTVCVTAPEEVRIARTMARDGVTEDKVRARIAAQMPEQERAQKADIVLVNDGKEPISVLVDSLYSTLNK